MLWTSQGAFFSAICERVARAEDRETPDVTAELAGRFALVFLAMEAVIRASATLLTKYVQLDFATVFYIFSALAVLSTLSFQALATEMGAAATRGSLCAKAFSAIAQWKDPKTWATRIKSEELFGAFWPSFQTFWQILAGAFPCFSSLVEHWTGASVHEPDLWIRCGLAWRLCGQVHLEQGAEQRVHRLRRRFQIDSKSVFAT